jgi:cytochrome c-type protein NapC
MTITTKLRGFALAAGLAIGAAAAGPALAEPNWDQVPGQDINLFYPGQASWEWALTQTKHSGAQVFRDKEAPKDCHECHDVIGKSDAPAFGKQIVGGEALASGQILEPNPIPGKLGAIVANVKMAHDADRFYVRLEFPDTPAVGAKMDPDYAVKATMMLNDGKVPEANRAGCWGACHEDLPFMANAVPGKDLTKYLTKTRVTMTAKGGGDIKPDADIEKMRADGYYLEYWQARLNAGKPAGAVDGFVLDKRVPNASPAVAATGKLEGGKWVVVLSRKLSAGAPYKDLLPGKTYTVGFAIHGGYAAKRFHWVSFEHTVALNGGDAQFVVK